MAQKLSEKIYEDIRRGIINGTYKIGSRLPTERDLAGIYGTNRPAIREAMTRLVGSGFAETRPQSGTYVKDFKRLLHTGNACPDYVDQQKRGVADHAIDPEIPRSQ